MRHLVSACLLLVALIHALPLAGVLGAAKLQALYGIAIDEPNLVLLMRHRAVLFGLLAYAAFRPELQRLAIVMGLASVISFLVLAWPAAAYNAAINRVVWADWLALVALLLAAGAHLIQPAKG
jgi:hypothetical protein